MKRHNDKRPKYHKTMIQPHSKHCPCCYVELTDEQELSE